ncbi:zinc-alpha-2-glycoprotein-like isoform X2 [Siphateles boraxobius]|uniref:zinc-alpha-2-glycoprotein-like isoform X2 n=1 Tax=Siphateles boraxobius TaxID=180520 RepID=UPI0040640925
MDTGVATKSFALCLFFFCGISLSLQTEKHSLYYIYTALSKPVELPGIYEFTAMGLLDDRQIDYYNSKDKKKIPTQHWMKEKMQEDYWEKGTQSRKSKEQWFNVNVKILMDRMNHSKSDVHVLQWRHGCEIDKEGTKVKFSKGIDEYSYDGDNFLSFDDAASQWVAPVDAALPTKRKWDGVPILNQYTKGYLEKECVDWLNKFRDYGDEEIRNGSPPDVHVFAKKSTSDKTKLKLTCMATGFYPKDLTMTIRKYRTSLPENEIESTGTRPNHNGTFQLRKSVDIKENEKAEYDCFVSHRTLKEPIVVKWDGKCIDCNEGSSLVIGIVIGAVLGLAFVICLVFYLCKTKIIAFTNQVSREKEIIMIMQHSKIFSQEETTAMVMQK